MSRLANKHIIIGVTGGIAAYKSPELVRRLVEEAARIQVVMSHHAQSFITPLTLQAVSGNPVRTELMDEGAEAAMGHIELARWADLIVVAPATANFMARLAGGFADDLLATLCLAARGPVALAPAMNEVMWSAAATQRNARRLFAIAQGGVKDQYFVFGCHFSLNLRLIINAGVASQALLTP